LLINRKMKNIEDTSEQMYQNFLNESKLEIPFNIEEIALGKINAHKKSKRTHRLRILTSGFAAAAMICIVFLIIKPHTPTRNLYSQNLSDSQKKEEFEKALRIINESLYTQEDKAETLYEDDNLEIVIKRK